MSQKFLQIVTYIFFRTSWITIVITIDFFFSLPLSSSAMTCIISPFLRVSSGVKIVDRFNHSWTGWYETAAYDSVFSKIPWDNWANVAFSEELNDSSSGFWLIVASQLRDRDYKRNKQMKNHVKKKNTSQTDISNVETNNSYRISRFFYCAWLHFVSCVSFLFNRFFQINLFNNYHKVFSIIHTVYNMFHH